MSDRRFYLAATAAFYAAWIAAYMGTGWYAAGLPAHDLTTAIDRAIPLVPRAVWVYQLVYLLPFLPAAVARDWHRLNRAFLALLLAHLLATAVYLFFPVAFAKPALGQSLAERVLALEYQADFTPGANNLPSLHVAFAWIFWLACRRQGLPRAAETAVLAAAAAITASTLLVKQHLLADAAAGLPWAFAAWFAAGRLYPRLAPGGVSHRQAFRALARRAALPAVAALGSLVLARMALGALGRGG